jgi:uncharacterized protein (TIGR00255 family)
MTGYAITTAESSAGTITLELKSVNSRFLDIQFRINDELRSIEPLLREAIMAKITRGKIECRLSLGKKEDTGQISLNQDALKNLLDLEKTIHKHKKEAAPLSAYEILKWPGIIEQTQIQQDTLSQEINQIFANTLNTFIESRAREGTALANMIQTRLLAIENMIHQITPLMPAVMADFQAKATQRMQDILNLSTENKGISTSITPEEAQERIRQEVTLYGLRIDIQEELSRLSTHITEVTRVLDKGGPVGKRLDFIMQELNREANTLGSKAPVKELSNAAIEFKLLIEQMREQIQNLE